MKIKNFRLRNAPRLMVRSFIRVCRKLHNRSPNRGRLFDKLRDGLSISADCDGILICKQINAFRLLKLFVALLHLGQWDLKKPLGALI